MKLWDKNITTNQAVHQFTVGNDQVLDMQLAAFDIYGNMAHSRMLQSIGILTEGESKELHKGLLKLLAEVEAGTFSIAPDTEDIHSEVEFRLTEMLGDLGKKIHTGRSRNDQVLVDLKMYVRAEIEEIVRLIEQLVRLLGEKSEAYKEVLLPGYTHFQVAMPSSVGLWLGAYAESLTDDLELLLGAYKQANKNPLGSGAGYGSSFPLDRDLTTRLLGFDAPNVNVVYAQMTRGKLERSTLYSLAGVAQSLAKLAYDNCLYMSQNYGFLSYPDELTTGSSIMPHKKNPDVW
ncbi:MAG: argininosuccinate lyase, partial [Imperialibacter sp.]